MCLDSIETHWKVESSFIEGKLEMEKWERYSINHAHVRSTEVLALQSNTTEQSTKI